MQRYNIYLRTYERRVHFAPPIRSIAWFDGEPVLHQKTDWLEFTYRLSASSPRLRLKVNGKSLEMPTPHLMVKRPGDVVEYQEPIVLEAFWISYSKEAMEVFQKAGVPEDLIGCELRFSPDFSRILREIHQTAPRAMESGMCERLDMLCFNLVQETVMNLRKNRGKGRNSSIEKIAEYFRNNFASNIDLDQLLAAQGLSRRNFFRRWKDNYNMTPAQYIIHLKMNEACCLLSETEKNLSEIAFALSFQSVSYFCNLFRRRFGLTPLEFRKRNRLNFIR